MIQTQKLWTGQSYDCGKPEAYTTNTHTARCTTKNQCSTIIKDKRVLQATILNVTASLWAVHQDIFSCVRELLLSEHPAQRHISWNDTGNGKLLGWESKTPCEPPDHVLRAGESRMCVSGTSESEVSSTLEPLGKNTVARNVIKLTTTIDSTTSQKGDMLQCSNIAVFLRPFESKRGSVRSYCTLLLKNIAAGCLCGYNARNWLGVYG